MTDQQQAIINDIFDNEEKYLSLAGEQKEDLIKLYKEFHTRYEKYALALSTNCIDMIGRYKANKEKKIDPFIAGGLADGIGGLGAGLYVASQTAANNEEIDVYRKYYKERVFESGLKLSSEEKSMLSVVGIIDAVLDSIPEIRSKREEEKSTKYDEAKKLMIKWWDHKDRSKAMIILAGLDGYRDSEELYEVCKKREKNKHLYSAHFYGLLCSVPFAVAMLIMGGVIGEFWKCLGVALLTFIMFYIPAFIYVTNYKQSSAF